MIPVLERIYVCDNPECVWMGKERVVQASVAAPGLYEWPVIVFCECRPDYVLLRKIDNEDATTSR